MTMLASQITSLAVVYSIVYSGVNQRKHQSSASLAFVREIHRGPVNFPHKWPVTRKMFPFDDVIMEHVSLKKWCIVGYGSGALWTLYGGSIGPDNSSFNHTATCLIFLNSSPPGQNIRYYGSRHFQLHFQISLKYVPRSPIDNKPALVQLMAWRRTGDKQLPGPIVTQFISFWLCQLPFHILQTFLIFPIFRLPW